jgi:outer membrane protein assembly factor BamB
MVINSSPRIDVFDPSTGKLLWHFGEPNRVPVSMPVYHDGTLYATRGFRSGPYMAVRVGGKDDVSKTHTKWHVPTGAPYISSILHYQGLIYMVSEGGVVTCVEPETGETVWKDRLDGVFTASPVAANGKVYMLNENGETFVLKAGRVKDVLERNSLGERTLASPAISGGKLFIRSDEHLFCIGQP